MAIKSRYKAYAKSAADIKIAKENRAKGIKMSILKALKDKKEVTANGR